MIDVQKADGTKERKKLLLMKNPLRRYGLGSDFEQMILPGNRTKDTTGKLRGKGSKSSGVEAC